VLVLAPVEEVLGELVFARQEPETFLTRDGRPEAIAPAD
jgi:hypothetical protein